MRAPARSLARLLGHEGAAACSTRSPSTRRGRILDGRNRFAACELAGIVPNYEAYEGDDPAGYVLATNINRRHLSKGQKAMIAAKVRSVSEQSVRSIAEQSGVTPTRIGIASTVLQHAPDLADAVAAGARRPGSSWKTCCGGSTTSATSTWSQASTG